MSLFHRFTFSIFLGITVPLFSVFGLTDPAPKGPPHLAAPPCPVGLHSLGSLEPPFHALESDHFLFSLAIFWDSMVTCGHKNFPSPGWGFRSWPGHWKRVKPMLTQHANLTVERKLLHTTLQTTNEHYPSDLLEVSIRWVSPQNYPAWARQTTLLSQKLLEKTHQYHPVSCSQVHFQTHCEVTWALNCIIDTRSINILYIIDLLIEDHPSKSPNGATLSPSRHPPKTWPKDWRATLPKASWQVDPGAQSAPVSVDILGLIFTHKNGDIGDALLLGAPHFTCIIA